MANPIRAAAARIFGRRPTEDDALNALTVVKSQDGDSPSAGRNTLAAAVAQRSRIDWESLVDPGEASAIAAVTAYIVDAFNEARLRVVRDTPEGEEEVDHPITALLAAPNDVMDGRELMGASIDDRILHGEFYWEVERSGRLLEMGELTWLPAGQVEVRGASRGRSIDAYRFYGSGIGRDILPRDIVRSRAYVDRSDPRLARAPIKSLKRELFADTEALLYLAQMLRNSGDPGTLVTPDGIETMSPGEIEAFIEKYTARFSGDGRGKPIAATAALKVQQIGLSPRDMQIREAHRTPEERISAVLRVPAIVAGLGAGLDRATYANYSEAREQAYETTIISLGNAIAQSLTNQILHREYDAPDLRVDFDTTAVRILQPDVYREHETTRADYAGGIITRAEARQARDFETVPADDVFQRPMGSALIPRDEVTLSLEDDPEPSAAPFAGTEPAEPEEPEEEPEPEE